MLIRYNQSISNKIRLSAIFVALACLGLLLFVVMSRVGAQSVDESASGRIITLYDRGVERSFVTNARTVGDALEDAGVDIAEQDRVEPSLDEQLISEEYTVNVYRARPVLVIDGQYRKLVMTAARSADQVAEDAGISLHNEDVAKLELSSDLLVSQAAEYFLVKRATLFTLNLYGKDVEARTQASTVGDMLAEKGIEMSESDRVSPSADMAINPGMTVKVWREGKQTITVEEDVDFEVEKIEDANRPKTYKEVKTAGEKGKKTVTYEIVIEGGHEVSRAELASVVTIEPKKQVEVVGTKSEYMQYTGGGNKDVWLSASVIPRDQWGYAEWLVQKESGWNPNAVNRSSGACGLAQALPCSKVGSDPHNPVVSLNWMHSYVMGRYGSWAAAVEHSKSRGWY